MENIYGIIIIIICFIPIIISKLSTHEGSLIPIMPLTGVYYLASFGIPLYLLDKKDYINSTFLQYKIISNDINITLIYIIYGIISLYLGFYGTKLIIKKKFRQ